MPALLVAGRDDLQDRHYLTIGVADRNAIRLAHVGCAFRAAYEPSLGRLGIDSQAPARGTRGRGQFQGDDVRLRTTRLLFDHRKITGGQPTRIERVPDGDRPALVEIMKAVGADASPVVDRHGDSLRRIRPSIGMITLPVTSA